MKSRKVFNIQSCQTFWLETLYDNAQTKCGLSSKLWHHKLFSKKKSISSTVTILDAWSSSIIIHEVIRSMPSTYNLDSRAYMHFKGQDVVSPLITKSWYNLCKTSSGWDHKSRGGNRYVGVSVCKNLFHPCVCVCFFPPFFFFFFLFQLNEPCKRTLERFWASNQRKDGLTIWYCSIDSQATDENRLSSHSFCHSR